MGQCPGRCNWRRVCKRHGISARYVRQIFLTGLLHRLKFGSVKTRIQVQVKDKSANNHQPKTQDVHYSSALDAIKKIVDDEGIAGLYSGINSSLIGVASTNFAYFYWYSVVRTLYVTAQKSPQAPSTAIELSLGAIAGAIAQVFTIPVSVITTRQQTQPKGDKRNLIETGREVIRGEDGWTGLWRGLKASLVLVVNPAITYGAYQRLRGLLFPGKSSLRPWESFGECLVPVLTGQHH